ncbi:MAG: hypothetical protein KDA61_13695 [Planctomycetales bacterium]|nr:hypothetical protein [Planctomycetales bacterium]
MHAEPNAARDDLLRRFFAGATEHAFVSRLGVADPPLVDYLAEMLVRFVRHDAIYDLRSPRGERLAQVVDMQAEAEARQGPARRRVHRHIGDFTLFWTGVYPEVADRMRRSSGKDCLIDYRDAGKRNYLMASRLPADIRSAPDDLLERLSDQFELCVYGLGEVRKAWEAQDDDRPFLVS